MHINSPICGTVPNCRIGCVSSSTGSLCCGCWLAVCCVQYCNHILTENFISCSSALNTDDDSYIHHWLLVFKLATHPPWRRYVICWNMLQWRCECLYMYLMQCISWCNKDESRVLRTSPSRRTWKNTLSLLCDWRLSLRFSRFSQRCCLVRQQRLGTACVSHHQSLSVNQRDPDDGTHKQSRNVGAWLNNDAA